MEEDWNMLAADCIVISCCCQCLVLQVIILLLLKLPYKLVQKTRELAKRKIRQRKRHEMKMEVEDRELSVYRTEFVANYIHGHSARYSSTGIVLDDAEHDCQCCMEDIENVFEELFRKGEFGFGSFWGREGPWTLPTAVAKNEIARYQIIETLGSLNCS